MSEYTHKSGMSVIQAAHYGETEAALADDPIIRAMAWEIPADTAATMLDGDPNWTFMQASLDEYKRRGGTIPTHIGGPARAVQAVLREIHEEGVR
jgi:hypothetical protein